MRELTAPGRGAIRVLEVGGNDAWRHVREHLSLSAAAEPLCFARLRSPGSEEILDEALVVVDGPDRVELHLHGSPPVVQRVLKALALPPGPEPPALEAGPGNASLEELAEARLSAASSEAAARMLLDQCQGALRRDLEGFLAGRGPEQAELCRRARIAGHLLRPPTVLLVGATNAGKSTLFNALVDRERVVVAALAGTTRDAIRERIRLGDYAVDLLDTAGERGPEDEVEAAGQALAQRLAELADLRLRLVAWEPELAPPSAEAKEVVLVTHGDRLPGSLRVPGSPRLRGLEILSALQDPRGARSTVERVFLHELALPMPAWTPGAGVPFLPALSADLQRAPDEARQRVRTWLAAPEGGAPER